MYGVENSLDSTPYEEALLSSTAKTLEQSPF